MISQLAEALEPQGASGSTEAAEDSSSSTGPLGHQNSDKFNFLSLIWVPDHTHKVGGLYVASCGVPIGIDTPSTWQAGRLAWQAD